MKIALLLLVSMVLVVGCYHEGNTEYKADLRKMPSNFTDHFPEAITNDMSANFIMNRDTTSGCIYYMIFEYKKNELTQSFLDTIINQSISKYQASDENIISVKRETVTYWHPEKRIAYEEISFNDKLYFPIPYFEKRSSLEYRGDINDIYSDTTTSGLSNDFMVYVFDFKPGIFWKGLSPSEYMPAQWKNGYSKGIAINEKNKVVVYWFIIW